MVLPFLEHLEILECECCITNDEQRIVRFLDSRCFRFCVFIITTIIINDGVIAWLSFDTVDVYDDCHSPCLISQDNSQRLTFDQVPVDNFAETDFKVFPNETGFTFGPVKTESLSHREAAECSSHCFNISGIDTIYFIWWQRLRIHLIPCIDLRSSRHTNNLQNSSEQLLDTNVYRER